MAQGPLEPLFTVEGRAALLFLPLAHFFARIMRDRADRDRHVLAHTPNMKNVGPDLQGFKPTFLLGVPRVFEKVYNGAEQKATADGKGKIFHAAADTAVAWSRARVDGRARARPRLKHAAFDKLVYGKLRAATGGKLSAARLRRLRPRRAARPLLPRRRHRGLRGLGPDRDLRAVHGQPARGPTRSARSASRSPASAIGIGEDGEVLVKGRHVFDGYWNNAEATAEAIDTDGWFHTGDVGELDNDGYLRITGRKKEIIVTAAGKNVAPRPMEDHIRAHPLVSQALVVGDDRPFIAALVTLDPEALEQWKAANGSGPPSPTRADPASSPRCRRPWTRQQVRLQGRADQEVRGARHRHHRGERAR